LLVVIIFQQSLFSHGTISPVAALSCEILVQRIPRDTLNEVGVILYLMDARTFGIPIGSVRHAKFTEIARKTYHR
jgi:hypothetical protein